MRELRRELEEAEVSDEKQSTGNETAPNAETKLEVTSDTSGLTATRRTDADRVDEAAKNGDYDRPSTEREMVEKDPTKRTEYEAAEDDDAA